jgi:hypothetical protein
MRMTNSTRGLMHKAMDGVVTLTPIMHQLSRYKTCDNILRWLISNRITGHNLADFVKVQHENSIMSMVKFIVKNQTKSKEEKAIVLGKDWV